jgi:glucosamine--fructose-6-phosphate aminotransferase (isomerizing)
VDGEPGARFLSEIEEQPAALVRVAARAAEIDALASRVRAARVVRVVAQGSSDNAASYSVYAFALLANLTAFRDSISLLIYYDAVPDLRDSVVVAVSQSGRTPDVVEYVQAARGQAALTVAITNDPASPLASAAEAAILLDAGEERSIAASKTYTTSLAALALLAAALGGGSAARLADGVRATAEAMAVAIPRVRAAVGGTAALIRAAEQLVVIGRGQELATAREIALKLSETSRLLAEALTSTALAHGPIAGVGPDTPVWVVASDDPCLPAALEAAARARRAGAPVIASGSAAERVPEAGIRLDMPAAPVPVLTPILSVLPGQLFAWALALARGLDPDAPAGLSKVTVVP